jgi:predicted site-specific integrase-resolvase
MSLKDYARQQGVSYRTAWRWWKAGKLRGQQMDTGTILIETEPAAHVHASQRVAIYARVSSAENKAGLDSQSERHSAHCAARGYQSRRWSKRWGPASMTRDQRSWRCSKSSPSA